MRPPAELLFPLFDYEHIGGRCSLTGGYVYRGFQSAVATGTYLYGDYCSGEIFARSGGTSSVLLDTTMLISSFGEDELGEVYVVDLNGSVSRIAGPRSVHVFDLADPRQLPRVRRQRNDRRHDGCRVPLEREQTVRGLPSPAPPASAPVPSTIQWRSTSASRRSETAR